MTGVTIARPCKQCGDVVELDACAACDGLDDDCDACGGAGVVVDGEPVKSDDLLCGGCAHMDLSVATRDWVG
jgi:hypothetical protein